VRRRGRERDGEERGEARKRFFRDAGGGGGAAALFHPRATSGGPRGSLQSPTGGREVRAGPRVGGWVPLRVRGEGDTYSGTARAGAVGWCGRSPPGAADMALIFSGAAWHGCMTPMTCIHPSCACPL